LYVRLSLRQDPNIRPRKVGIRGDSGRGGGAGQSGHAGQGERR